VYSVIFVLAFLVDLGCQIVLLLMILSYLCLALFGFVMASPQFTVLSSRFPINACSDRESAYRPMSGKMDDVDSVPLSDGDSSTELLSAERLVCGTVRERRRWSREENCELMRCYYKAKAAGKGYQKRLKEMWDSRNPAKVFRTMNNLCCQALNVICTHLLTVIELEEFHILITDGRNE